MEHSIKEWIKQYANLTDSIGELVIVLDSSFELLHANQKAVKAFLIDDYTLTLEQIFYKETVGYLTDEIGQVLFTNQKKTIKDFLIKINADDSFEFDLTISTVEINSDKIIFLIFNELINKKPFDSIEKIQIKLGRIFPDNQNEEIKSLIKNIEDLIPFTVIGLRKLQTIIDAYSFPIWIKDLQSRFIAINKSYADELGIDFNLAPGKKHESFLPAHLISVYKSLDEYILSNSNPVLLESTGKNVKQGEVNKIIAQIPLPDNRDKVYALIGLIYDKDKLKQVNNSKTDYKADYISESILDLIERFPRAAALLNSGGKIEQVNQEFCKFLDKESENIYQKNFIELFPYLFTENIKSFIESDLLNDNLFLDKDLNPVDQFNSIANALLIKVSTDITDKKEIIIIIDDSQNLNVFDNELQNILKNRGKMFDVLIQNNPEPIFIYDKENLKFLEVNEAAIKLYGFSREEFLQMDLTDLYAPEDIQTLLSSFGDESTEGLFSKPFRHKRKDGSTVVVEISKTSFRFNDREAHFNIVKDVTASVEQEKQNQILKVIFKSTDSLVITTDAAGFITFINNPVIENLGFTSDELIQSSFASLVVDDDRGLINSSIFQPEVKDEISLDSKVKTSDGNYIDAEITAYPILDYNHEVSSFTIIVKLKKQLVKSEEPREIIKEVVKEKEADLEKPAMPALSSKLPDANFISGVFHEILTPMNVIIGFAQELVSGFENPTEEQTEAADIINQNRLKMMSTMNALSEYSDIVQNKTEIKIDEIPITDVVDSLDKNINEITGLNDIQFSYGKISSSLKFKSDKQKFENLILYLIKVISRLSKDKKVYFSAYPIEPDSFFIGLSDQYGHTSDYVADTFDKVFNENKNPKDFGLPTLTTYLANVILSLLGGKYFKSIAGAVKNDAGFLFPQILTIKTDQLFKEPSTEPEIFKDVEPEKPEQELVEGFTGSEIVEGEQAEEFQESDLDKQLEVEEDFTKSSSSTEEEIPADLEEEPQSEITETLETEIQQETKEEISESQVKEFSVPVTEAVKQEEAEFIPPKPQLNLSDLICLYIEDQVDSQILFKVQMKGLKDIKFAVSFEDAQPILLNNKFDFIIMDINLQGEYNGLDALKIIKTMPALSNIPIIAVTAYVLPGDKEKFIAAGFDDFISKPIFREKMMESLEKIFLPKD